MGVLDRIGNEVGDLGDRIGVDFMRYNPIAFKRFDEMGVNDAPVIVRALRSYFPAANRVIDVGAGSGAFAAECRRQGLEVTGIERSRHGRRYAAKRHSIEVLPFDLADEPPAKVTGPFDLAYCLEVAEHVPEGLADRLVSFLCGLAPTIVFTAASPGQGGTGHINEQPPSYWTERFRALGCEQIDFDFDFEGLSPHWAKTNILAFTQ
ncbi:MAG: hypothetical protein QOJ29_2805 [Thermoleophilaceae bacterium]|jgi:SAM-dependent methyltransferase|nr:hypothetical protein [Thermoleophilaceae bacterium]